LKTGLDRQNKFFKEQYWYAKTFLKNYLPNVNYKNIKILEIGSAEGGCLKFFNKLGAKCYGIEISKGRNKYAKNRNSKKIKFLLGDICDSSFVDKIPKMDIIILRDVIEHIDQKLVAMKNIYSILKRNGIIFVSYPPKYSPYAGHQQNVKNKYGRLPFIHLLPPFLYSKILNLFGEKEIRIKGHLSTKNLMISIRKIEKIFNKTGFTIYKKDFYFIRPCFEKRFGLKPRKTILNNCPIFREVFTLGAIYLLKKNYLSFKQ